MQLPSPEAIKAELPLKNHSHIAAWREAAIAILERRDPRLSLIVGPCSIHDPEAVYEYAVRLKNLAPEIPAFFPIMRLFFEKARTRIGWKGMLYDPHLDGTHDIASGIRASRALILKIADLGIAGIEKNQMQRFGNPCIRCNANICAIVQQSGIQRKEWSVGAIAQPVRYRSIVLQGGAQRLRTQARRQIACFTLQHAIDKNHPPGVKPGKRTIHAFEINRVRCDSARLFAQQR